MDYLLPPTVYHSPPRLARDRKLNTIPEDYEDTMFGPPSSDSEATGSDDTVVGIGLDMEKGIKQAPSRSRAAAPDSPVSVVSSNGGSDAGREPSSRSSYAGSDAGTTFSESCPSLTGSNTSGATTFVTNSSRTSIASRSSRNRYPALLIPRGSWDSCDEGVKQMTFGMSPSTRILLSPEVLRSLPQQIPSLDVPPSLGDGSSIGSGSPYPYDCSSLPATPDLHNLDISEGQSWGGNMTLETPLEIAIDEHHSILLSAAEAHSSNRLSIGASSDWNSMMGNFPRIPGATPQDLTPITPNIDQGVFSGTLDDGVQLPAGALEVLRSLTRVASPSLSSESDVPHNEEMQQVELRSMNKQSRPRSFDAQTPISNRSFSNLSDYSYSGLSIPSPGGFFSSLKPSARRTWSSFSGRSSPPPPSSTTAENFYNTPWTKPRQDQVVETVVEVPETTNTDGPPTVKQAVFNEGVRTPITKETEDMYGSGVMDQKDSPPRPLSNTSTIEHDKAYEEGIKQAAEVNFDRTSHWLAAQTTYLAALRETNPLNDPADFAVAKTFTTADDEQNQESLTTATEKAVRFLQEANRSSPGVGFIDSPSNSPREGIFLEAFNFVRSEAKRADTFIQASARLEVTQSTRVALPKLHVQTLLNNHDANTLTSQYVRPKYRGPFSQNPRQTGVFSRTEEQDLFASVERQQKALAAILPSVWKIDAQRKVLYNGRLLACSAASENLTRKSAKRDSKKSIRVLDLGGSATASWAWAAASKWRNVKVFTVQSRQQVDHKTSSPVNDKVDATQSSTKPANPTNHRVVAVPHLWQLPFKANHFDVISARTLHMYLRSAPVPAAESIDEWDMTLKECMRVLKPGGILDFFIMDSGISNSTYAATGINTVDLSPNAMEGPFAVTSTESSSKSKQIADSVTTEFATELKQRGYEQDGGCARLMSRLKKAGFVNTKRQWVGLPMGPPADGIIRRGVHSRTISAESHSTNSSTSRTGVMKENKEPPYAFHFNTDGTSRGKSFRLAPRPISEVSSVSRIVDQYLNYEAVQGPVGSTFDVSAMSALLGELSWEEWFVRLRLEAGKQSEEVLEGVHETLEEYRRSGDASWRCLVGWARKPHDKDVKASKKERKPTSKPAKRMSSIGSAFGIEPIERVVTPLVLDTRMSQTRAVYEQYYGEHRQHFTPQRERGISHASVKTLDVSQSAIERGEAGEIPMMMFGL